MKNLYALNQYRDTSDDVANHYGSTGDHTCGAFTVPSPIDSAPMTVIASAGGGWDHVSVSRKNRCPNWIGMENGGQLNPAHSRYLMGYPPEWDACAPMATPSCRKSRRNSSKTA